MPLMNNEKPAHELFAVGNQRMDVDEGVTYLNRCKCLPAHNISADTSWRCPHSEYI